MKTVQKTACPSAAHEAACLHHASFFCSAACTVIHDNVDGAEPVDADKPSRVTDSDRLPP
jgi:hypothetical protein